MDRIYHPPGNSCRGIHIAIMVQTIALGLMAAVGCDKNDGSASNSASTTVAPPQPTMSIFQAAATDNVDQITANLATNVAVDSMEVTPSIRPQGAPQNDRLFTPLDIAAGAGHLNAAQLLIDKGASVNARTSGQLTPLYFAIRAGSADLVKLLVTHKAGVAACDANGLSGLQTVMIPTQCPNAGPIIDSLVSGGDNMEIKTKFYSYGLDSGSTVLACAVQMHELEAVTALARNGADLNAKDDNGNSIWVLSAGHVDNTTPQAVRATEIAIRQVLAEKLGPVKVHFVSNPPGARVFLGCRPDARGVINLWVGGHQVGVTPCTVAINQADGYPDKAHGITDFAGRVEHDGYMTTNLGGGTGVSDNGFGTWEPGVNEPPVFVLRPNTVSH
jgi:Ankyrin repeats (many copies)